MTLSLVLLTLLTILFAPQAATAHHVPLSWRPFLDSPARHGYTKWCTAFAAHQTLPKVFTEYRCKDSLVAVWNADGLPNETLEFATACGGGGYAWFRAGKHLFCPAKKWVVCAGDSSPESITPYTCYGVFSEDDGYWPTQLHRDQIPDQVDIWYNFHE
ncbi:unnamed protein product [Jaminaea pallidilutea]